MISGSKQNATPSNSHSENLAYNTNKFSNSGKGLKKFWLSKKEKIKSKKEFDLIYSAGEQLISPSQKLKALYIIDRNSGTPGIKTAYAVSRKAGNAVWRNRVKRLLRESFRLNKEQIINECGKKSIKLLIVFSPFAINKRNCEKIFLKDVLDDVVGLMNKIRAKL